MTWLQRYRLHNFLKNSVWLPPLLGMLAALLLFPLIQKVDLMVGWTSVMRPDSARVVLAALVTHRQLRWQRALSRHIQH